MVACPLCNKSVNEALINEHIDSGCVAHVVTAETTASGPAQANGQGNGTPSTQKTHSFFSTPAVRRPNGPPAKNAVPAPAAADRPKTPPTGTKRSFGDADDSRLNGELRSPKSPAAQKRTRLSVLQKVAPLAERMRPTSLDQVYGQELVGPNGLLRGMIETNTIPSMILWGGPGTGKTTIARLIAHTSGARFAEINSTSSGVADVKKIFNEALSELQLTGRKTIIFCDEIHRFSKSQQDVFLGPVEAGQVTLIAATTENPSFKVISALLSRCRTFTLSKLSDPDIVSILTRALTTESYEHPLLDHPMLTYFASFSDGDARTALNLLDLAISLTKTKPPSTLTPSSLKKELTRTLVYDRAGDQHYDNISALHKSIRGSDPNASLYYLSRMLTSGEDPLYIARRLIVVASEDVGLADNTLLSLATSTYTACQYIGMPECRINLAHCVVALCQAPKSTRAYRALKNVMQALDEPGVAGLPVPVHLRNAPTRLMKEMGYGREYKYNPDFVDGKVVQEYLPEKLRGRTFLEDSDFGNQVDPDLEEEEEDLMPEVDD